MNSDLFKLRTKSYALKTIQLTEALPKNRSADVIAKQLVRSATSVGANYRAACRAKSTADFIAKMKIVEEEADEALYWMELLQESGFSSKEDLAGLMKEGNELLAMTVASIKTTRNNR